MTPSEARLPVSRLFDLFELDAASGTIRWKVRPVEHFASAQSCRRWNIRFAGKDAGNVTGQGYRQVSIDCWLYLVHRIIFAMHTGQWPEQVVDHIDRNRANNRPDNLRDCSTADNNRNRSWKA